LQDCSDKDRAQVKSIGAEPIQRAGWVERSETHPGFPEGRPMTYFGALNPSYGRHR